MEELLNYYQSFDEWGRLDREPVEFMVNYRHILSNLPSKGHILDIGAGPGKYSIAMAKSGYEVTLADLTPRLVEIAKHKVKEAGVEKQFSGYHVADARELSRYTDEQFDASLILGPLYHLQTEEGRIKAVNEVWRVTKRGGLVFVAFMSRIRHLITSMLYPEAWKPNHTAFGIKEFLESGVYNHTDEGRFTGAYYFNIEDIKPFMESQGFESVKLISSGSVAGAMTEEQWNYWRQRGEAEYERVLEIIMEASESPYIQGMSSHLLYIGRKVGG
jgi:ubiquinone/menaquinone biosynthesis C-methylase UbiE